MKLYIYLIGSTLLFSSCFQSQAKLKTNYYKEIVDLIEVDGDEDNTIEIETNKTKTFRLPQNTKSIMVGNPKIADAHVQNKKFFSVSGEKNGETTIKLIFIDKNGEQQIISKRILVSYSLTLIRRELRKRFPKSDIIVENLGTFIALSGTVDTPKTASDVMEFVGKIVGNEKNIINNMSIAVPTQVMLKVKVAKLDRSVSKSLGINWRSFSLGRCFNILGFGGTAAGALPAVLTAASAAAGTVTAGETSTPSDGGSAPATSTSTATTDTSSFVTSAPTTVPGSGATWYISHASDNGSKNISAVIDALAEESLATVLAEPTLVALSGQEAQFQSGGEQPYRDSSTTGTASSVEFKDWGIMLKFTPNVISENRISITVDSEISSVEAATNGSEPPLAKQNVKTTVELGSGQSLAIAGLLKKEANKTATELPGLARIPLLGGLFRSGSDTLKESELVIIVTPYIVRPSSKQLVNPVERAPKMITPCRGIFFRKFVSEDKEITNHAGFTVS